MADHVKDGDFRDKTEIGGPRRRMRCLRLKFLPGLVQVNLLEPEEQGFSSACKCSDLHPEDPDVESAGVIDVFNRQDKVINRFDIHGLIQVYLLRNVRGKNPLHYTERTGKLR